MLQQTNLKDEHVMAAEWDKATALQVKTKDIVIKLFKTILMKCNLE